MINCPWKRCLHMMEHGHSVSKEILLLRMLKAGRRDAFIGDEINFDYLIYKNGYKGFFDKSYKLVSEGGLQTPASTQPLYHPFDTSYWSIK